MLVFFFSVIYAENVLPSRRSAAVAPSLGPQMNGHWSCTNNSTKTEGILRISQISQVTIYLILSSRVSRHPSLILYDLYSIYPKSEIPAVKRRHRIAEILLRIALNP